MQKKSQVFPALGEETKIIKLAEKQDVILFKAKTVFPFTLFPDRIIIRPDRIDLIIGEFFHSRYTKTILLADIISVEIGTIPFLASITIITTEPITISNFKQKDAIKIKEILDGLKAASRQDIDIAGIKPRILPKIEKAGKLPEDIKK